MKSLLTKMKRTNQFTVLFCGSDIDIEDIDDEYSDIDDEYDELDFEDYRD